MQLCMCFFNIHKNFTVLLSTILNVGKEKKPEKTKEIFHFNYRLFKKLKHILEVGYSDFFTLEPLQKCTNQKPPL